MGAYSEVRTYGPWAALARPRPAASPLHRCLVLSILFAWGASAQAVGLRAPEFIAELVDGPTGSYPLYGCEMNRGILFLARPGSYATQLYFTDGTEEGTTRMGNDFEDAHATGIENFAGCGPRAHFAFFDSNEVNVPGTLPPAYPGVLVTDGTIAGTRPLLPPHASISSLLQFGDATIPDGSRILLNATDSTDWGTVSLWVSDGTAAGTHPLEKTGGGQFLSFGDSVAHGAELNFVEYLTDRLRFWGTDGTTAGTHLVGTVTFAPGDSLQAWRVRPDGRLLYRWSPASHTTEILLLTWSGELRVLGALPSLGDVNGQSFENIGTQSYLQVPSNAEVWVTDGTPGSLHAAYSYSHDSSIDGRFTAIGPSIYFADDRGSLGVELWRFDSELGTVVLANDFCPGPCSSHPVIQPADGSALVYTTPEAPHLGHAYWIGESDHQAEPMGPFCGVSCQDGASYLGKLGEYALISAPTSSGQWGLWSFLPSDFSVRQLSDFSVWNFEVQPRDTSVLEHVAYLWGDSPATGYEPWRVRAVPDPCSSGGETLCLAPPRFSVQVDWRDFAGHRGTGHATPLTTDTGYFWFFDDANVELTVKVIDGTGLNGHYWVYYGALSNVEYWITIEDTVTGESKQYHNPLGQFGSFGDIEALPAELGTFAVPAASSAALTTPALAAPAPEPLAVPDFGGSGTCTPSATNLCLLDGRFQIEASWTDFTGHSGVAYVQQLTPDTGYFWFFSDSNVEIVTKLVDGSAFNDHFWVYYGALSNVEYTLTVTDTVAGGPPRIYHNALRQFGSFGDIEAFPAP